MKHILAGCILACQNAASLDMPQPNEEGQYPTLEQISLMAIRKK
jgi:hypothetical protein